MTVANLDPISHCCAVIWFYNGKRKFLGAKSHSQTRTYSRVVTTSWESINGKLPLIKGHSFSFELFSVFSALFIWWLTRRINSHASTHIFSVKSKSLRLLQTHMHATFINSNQHPKLTLSKGVFKHQCVTVEFSTHLRLRKTTVLQSEKIPTMQISCFWIWIHD